MDFTLSKYEELLEALVRANYSFQSFSQFLRAPKERCVILRHDVDDKPSNSLTFAQIQNKRNISGTYYFRCVPQSYNAKIIKEIHQLKHEIGYHYEEMDICKGNAQESIALFQNNLKMLREIVPIDTICMHGSPRSKFDNKDLWINNNYSDYQIIGEPYLDLNFKQLAYLTDTGRRWNGEKYSIRDKVSSAFEFNFKTTNDVISAIQEKKLPNQMMMTFHPQRWNSNLLFWGKEFVFQNAKNIVKRVMIQRS